MKRAKPKTLEDDDGCVLAEIVCGYVSLGSEFVTAKDCERLAAWLLKAAEWLRAQETK